VASKFYSDMQTERRGHCPNRALIASTADACEQAASKASLLLLTLQGALHFISAKFQTLQHLGVTIIPLWQHQSTRHIHSNFKKVSVVEAKPQQAAAMIKDEVVQIHQLDQRR
jgi:hypothetical protein